jgi:hypothetical protein
LAVLRTTNEYSEQVLDQTLEHDKQDDSEAKLEIKKEV